MSSVPALSPTTTTRRGSAPRSSACSTAQHTVLDAGGCRILGCQTVLGADDNAPVPPQPRDNGQQTVETAPHHQSSPVQGEEQRTGPADGGALDGPRDRSGKRRPVLTKDLNILQVDVRMPEQETRSDLINGGAPARDVLHRHGPEDAERLNALKQGGSGTVVGRTGRERFMRERHAAIVAP